MKKRWIAIPLALVLCVGAGIGAYFYMNQNIRPDYGIYQYTDETGTVSSITLTKDTISFQNFDFSDYEYTYALSCRLSDIQDIKNEGGTVAETQMEEMLEHYLELVDYSRFEKCFLFLSIPVF